MAELLKRLQHCYRASCGMPVAHSILVAVVHQDGTSDLNCKSSCSSGSPNLVGFRVDGTRQVFFNLVLEDTEEKSNKYGSAWCLLTLLAT